MKHNRLFTALSCLALLLGGCKGNNVPTSEELKEFTVTFNAEEGAFNDDTKVKTVKVQEGQTVSKPGDPYYRFHEFDYWYKDGDSEESFEFDTLITEDLNLHAKYYQDPCTIFACTYENSTLRGNQLTLDLSSKETVFDLKQYLVMSEGAVAFAIDPVTQVSYGASGIPLNGYDNQYTLRVYSKNNLSQRDYTLSIYQHFDAAINFYVQGVLEKTVYTAAGESFPLWSHTHDDVYGYNFHGWKLDPDATESVYAFTPNDDTDVYAHLEPKNYNLVLNPDGGLIDGSPYFVTVNVSFGSSFTLPVASKEGSYFLGWADKDNVHNFITDADGNSLEPWNRDENYDVPLVAVYEPVLMPVFFEVDGQVVHSDSSTYGETYIPAYHFRPNDPDDYTEFKYWTLDGQRCDSVVATGAMTFVAVFGPRTINVHYGESDVIEITYGQTFEIPVCSVEPYYEFQGYQYNGQMITDNAGYGLAPWTYTTEKDVHVTAVSSPITYHFFYYVNGQRIRTVDYPITEIDPNEPLWDYQPEEGQYFYGWHADPYYLCNSYRYVQTIGDCYPYIGSLYEFHIYGATSEIPNMDLEYYDTMGCYGVTSFSTNIGEQFAFTIPAQFNNSNIGILGDRWDSIQCFPTHTTTITLHTRLLEFGIGAFMNLQNLDEIYLTEAASNPLNLKVTNDHKVFYSYDADAGESYIYAVAKNITSFSCPGTITNIGHYAFECCTLLSSIELDVTKLNYVGVGAFSKCNGIEFRIHGTSSDFERVFNSDNLPTAYTVNYL